MCLSHGPEDKWLYAGHRSRGHLLENEAEIDSLSKV